MTNTHQKVLDTFADAVIKLLTDMELAYANPSERAIVARLSNLLQGRYPGWSLDLEWSRQESVVKRLHYRLLDEQLIGNYVIIPDLIIHRVGKRENLLVVEVKKATNTDYEGDIWKLKGMTDQTGTYGYLVGLHLVVDLKAGMAVRCDVYVDAELNEDLTEWMRNRLSGAAD